jgi:hypothetical protein
MAAVRIIAGKYREIWVENDPHAGGEQRTISTGIHASSNTLSRMRAEIMLSAITGAANISAVIAPVNGFLHVIVTNSGAGNTSATYTLDVSRAHSMAQANDGNHTVPVYVLSNSGGQPATATMIATPGTLVQINSANNTITLTGTNTAWIQGSTTFTASSGTITNQVVNSLTSATLTYTAPAGIATITVSDGNITTTFSVVAASMSVNPTNVVGGSSGNVLALTGVNTIWGGGTTFTVSSGSITAQNVNTTTSASITFTAPVGNATITISTTSGSGQSTTFTVTASSSPSMTATPTRAVGTNTTLNTINMVGTNTAWDGSTTFVPSSGTVTNTTINTPTSATLTYSAPAGNGTITMTQGSINATFSVVASSMTALPANVAVNTAGNVIALTGTNTNWINGVTTFSVSVGTITAQSVTSATTAEITYTSPIAPATITVSGGGQSTTFGAVAGLFDSYSARMGTAADWDAVAGITTGSDSISMGAVAGAGVLVGTWFQAPDIGPAPWARGNQNVLAIQCNTPGGLWQLECVTANGVATVGPDAQTYQVNTQFRANNGTDGYEWLVDLALADLNSQSYADVTGSVACCWQIIIGATSITVRQWIKFGLTGIINKTEQTIQLGDTDTAGTLRYLLVNGDPVWTVGQANAWTPAQAISGIKFGIGLGDYTRAKVYALTSDPTDATINELMLNQFPDTYAAVDSKLTWESGAAVTTDRSGHAATVTVNGTLLEGRIGPIENPSGVAPVVTDWAGQDIQLTTFGSSATSEPERAQPDPTTPGARNDAHFANFAGCPLSRFHPYAQGGSALSGLNTQISTAIAAGHLGPRTIATMDWGTIINEAWGDPGGAANLADPTLCAAYVAQLGAPIDAVLATGARVLLLEPPSASAGFISDGGAELRIQVAAYLASRVPAWDMADHQTPVYSLTAVNQIYYQDIGGPPFDWPGPHLTMAGANLIGPSASVRIAAIAAEIGYPAQVIVVTPSGVIPASSTGNILTVAGTYTAWTPGTPGTPAFSVSAGTITAQTINSATSATLTYTAPAAPGTITVSLAGSSATDTFDVSAASIPSYSVEVGRRPYGVDSLLFPVPAAATPTNGALYTTWIRQMDVGSGPLTLPAKTAIDVLSLNNWQAVFECAETLGDADPIVFNSSVNLTGRRVGAQAYIGNVASLMDTNCTRAIANGWVWYALQVIVTNDGNTANDATTNGITIRQWRKYGTSGVVSAAATATRTIAQIRVSLVAEGWTQVQADAWNLSTTFSTTGSGEGDLYFHRFKMYDQITEPTVEALEIIAQMAAPDATAFSDVKLAWESGAAVLADQSGNSHPITRLDGGVVLYQGPLGPIPDPV